MIRGTATLKFYRLKQSIAGTDSARAAAARSRWDESERINDNAAYYDRYIYGGRPDPRW